MATTWTTPAPSAFWRMIQALRGTNSTFLTNNDVPETDLQGKWILITGANNGIGLEAANTFSKWGANLILGCRDAPAWETHPSIAVAECLELAKSAGHTSTIEWWEVDFSDLDSVSKFAQRWIDSERPLDILCNNAGVSPTPCTDTIYTKDGFEFLHQINLLSHIYLTFSLLPSLAKAPEPRIVCTTSCFHFFGHFELDHFNGEEGMQGDPYGNNKLYLQVFVAELQKRLLESEKLKHITVNGINPGYVNTGIWNNPRPDLGPSRKKDVMKRLAGTLAITSQQGSIAIVNAATSPEFGPDPNVQGVGAPGGKGGGHYINRIWLAKPMPYCADEAARLALWTKVVEVLRLKEKGLYDVFSS
ncbi:hypothetical protein EDB81DRAFT_453845 [Dactylonectria macrodidyma]|uniref:NAD(P)-binding protein n=1 Tax=Dactylonectria macrodidyma TaxID=307937 RepID=A0A9P9JDT2_9HYPO|nr:hypothetical protein EDB81DRAFT_453845 [Dactylonectria macrodidyma]